MSLIARFVQYAAAFEKTYDTNDFSLLDDFFTDDIVYETSGGEPMNSLSEGRAAVYAYLEESLDNLDRLFPTRTPGLLEGPTETDNTVWFRWTATYSKPGLPDLFIEGEERLVFERDLIRRMEDRFSADTVVRATEYLATHAEALQR